MLCPELLPYNCNGIAVCLNDALPGCDASPMVNASCSRTDSKMDVLMDMFNACAAKCDKGFDMVMPNPGGIKCHHLPNAEFQAWRDLFLFASLAWFLLFVAGMAANLMYPSRFAFNVPAWTDLRCCSYGSLCYSIVSRIKLRIFNLRCPAKPIDQLDCAGECPICLAGWNPSDLVQYSQKGGLGTGGPGTPILA